MITNYAYSQRMLYKFTEKEYIFQNNKFCDL